MYLYYKIGPGMAPRLLTVSPSTELDEAELEMMDLVGSTKK
jgi:hypothetical protein